jgi:hypothetical protein
MWVSEVCASGLYTTGLSVLNMGRPDTILTAMDAQFAGETVRNLIPTHAESEHIAEYLAEPLEVHTMCQVHRIQGTPHQVPVECTVPFCM